ncbi:MAG: cytidylate kinase [Gemmatimonadetes bacterium 13_1_40CM_4_69_8]|nr:MAG: cytidylate kinase [Gemmatimonadetes bacterium 13_1_40CM_4_69_8]
MVRVIAIDGPAASGKSTTAAAVARALGGGWAHLDSGALYRAVTLAALDNIGEGGQGKWEAQKIVNLGQTLPVQLVLAEGAFIPTVAGVDVEEAIRSERVTRQVSAVAALPEVRAWVNAQQRRAAQAYPAGVVVDGRDIGTVVFPEAPQAEERARRRITQRKGGGGGGGGQTPDEATLRRESEVLAARDAADASRAVAPLRPAADAVLLDTTHLSFEDQVARIVALARERFPG